MTAAEFADLAQELRGQWGESAFAQVQLALLQDIVAPLSAYEFRKVMNELAMNCTRPPSVAVIKGACLPLLQRYEEALKRSRIASSGGCVMCAGAGWVLVYRDEDPTKVFGYVCTCPAPAAIGIQLGASRTSPSAKGMAVLYRPAMVEEGWHRIDHTFASWKAHQDAMDVWLEARGIRKVRSHYGAVADAGALIQEAIAGARSERGAAR